MLVWCTRYSDSFVQNWVSFPKLFSSWICSSFIIPFPPVIVLSLDLDPFEVLPITLIPCINNFISSLIFDRLSSIFCSAIVLRISTSANCTSIFLSNANCCYSACKNFASTLHSISVILEVTPPNLSSSSITPASILPTILGTMSLIPKFVKALTTILFINCWGRIWELPNL